MENILQAPKPLQRLPMELRCGILASLSDLQSLASAAQTCRALYWAFKVNEKGLIRDVLINCVGFGALPEAIIAHRCCPPCLSTCVELPRDLSSEKQIQQQHNYVSDFLQRLERPIPSSTTWTMRDALTLGNFHLRVVSKLTQRFIQACARASSSRFPLEDSLCLRCASHPEEERIARTLYRFEIFRKLFGCFCDDEEELLRYAATFFSKFAPWENTQLGCIHDFLAREIIPAFNDVAEHDIVWGGLYTDFKADIGDQAIQQLLTLGLERILEIASCDLYADRERLLRPNEVLSEENDTFLRCALDNIRELSPLEGVGLDILEAPPFSADDDIGAENIWKLSLTHDPDAAFAIYEWADWSYRRWGYVLWDYERLQALGTLEQLWMPALRLECHLSPAAGMEMRASWAARGAMYRRGGRGYWEEDDESHIVWPERNKKEDPELPQPTVPESLAEAKDLLRKLSLPNIGELTG